jgi:hypothetical protein
MQKLGLILGLILVATALYVFFLPADPDTASGPEGETTTGPRVFPDFVAFEQLPRAALAGATAAQEGAVRRSVEQLKTRFELLEDRVAPYLFLKTVDDLSAAIPIRSLGVGGTNKEFTVRRSQRVQDGLTWVDGRIESAAGPVQIEGALVTVGDQQLLFPTTGLTRRCEWQCEAIGPTGSCMATRTAACLGKVTPNCFDQYMSCLVTLWRSPLSGPADECDCSPDRAR